MIRRQRPHLKRDRNPLAEGNFQRSGSGVHATPKHPSRAHAKRKWRRDASNIDPS
jgi:hypothetical protein